jgi:DNA (cytosine-5)-methyltransferase 1
MRYIDLFCGMGSFHHSFSQKGWECVLACDINKNARKTYTINYGKVPLSDIRQIDPSSIPSFDILCAGFPCQPFSKAGKQKGFEDDRGNLFFDILKFIKHHSPKYIVLENVKSLKTHDKGNTFTTIVDHLESCGYAVEHNILTCSDYGIPQMRKRLFIIATLAPVAFFSDGFHKQPMTSLSKLLGQNFQKDIAYTLRCGGRHSPINCKHNWDGYWIGDKDPKQYRLSVRDGLKLQGFPDDFKFECTNTAKWKMLGNTIPTNLTRIIADRIEHLESSRPAKKARANAV